MCQLEDKLIVLLEIMDGFENFNTEPITEAELEFIIMKYGDEAFKVEKSDESEFDEFYYDGEAYLNPAEMDKLLDEWEYDENSNVIEGESEAKVNKRNRKRIGRRGGRNKGNSKKKPDLKILQTNCDGYTSKKESVENIVEKRHTDVLLLNDTALKGKRNVKIKNYFSFAKNRTKAKGGVATVVSNHL